MRLASRNGVGKMAEEINNGEIVEKVVAGVMPVIASAAMSFLVAEVVEALMQAVVTNVRESTLAGDDELHPTKHDASMEKNETSASSKEESLAHDDVSAQKGEVDAAETEAKAATGEATATESGASAVRTKAGASDIETKALKMM